MKQHNFVTPCTIMHRVFQLLATSKILFLHVVSLKIVPVSHVDHSTPYCIHGWFSSCHPFVFVFSLAFYEFFMFKLVLFILPVACCFCLFIWMCVYLCMSVTVFIYVCMVYFVCHCYLFLIISVGLRALQSSCLPVYLYICLPTLNKDYYYYYLFI
jgi:hypothetical protein